MWDEFWGESALCRAVDPDALFVRGAMQNDAKRVCRACPVRSECLAEALDGRVEYGVWGGMTERDRRAILRRRPDITSWREFLEAAQTRVIDPGLAPPVRRATPIRRPVSGVPVATSAASRTVAGLRSVPGASEFRTASSPSTARAS